MPLIKSLGILFKSVSQLGPAPVLRNAIYRLGLACGYWKWRTPSPAKYPPPPDLQLSLDLHLPDRGALLKVFEPGKPVSLAQAEEICQGRYRPFGGPTAPLSLALDTPLVHWTEYERGHAPWGSEDVKDIWEPARFSWAVILARAYRLTNDEKYAQQFWQLFDSFVQNNPPYVGPNWTSGQETAIRIISLTLALAAFINSPFSTVDHLQSAAYTLATHAGRISPTLIYAQSQRNNHLLTEAAGLFTAGCVLQNHPNARRWRSQGWKLLNRTLIDQIAPDGAYIQHSTNYHRLMLETALWAFSLASLSGEPFPNKTTRRLSAAADWLTAQVDPLSGQVPNLGHNDGAHLLPLSDNDYADFRPAIQAACRAFCGSSVLPPGTWDELSVWLSLSGGSPPLETKTNPLKTSPFEINTRAALAILHTPLAWASLRCVHFTFRPAQADQLHVDLWWNGFNIARDAGTFRYTASSPWDNALASTRVHNTITIDGKDQMTSAGRFLWLDWAQAVRIRKESVPNSVAARHDGYRKLGIVHHRTLTSLPANHWQVTDELLPAHPSSPDLHSFTLHWLLPDWPWELAGTTLRLISPTGGRVTLSVGLAPGSSARSLLQVIRAGKVIAGSGSAPEILGWYSPTYSVKLPAVSLRFQVEGASPLVLISDWVLS